MEPIFRNSEPAHRAPLSQWQRDTMGKVQPAESMSDNTQAWWLAFIFLVLVPLAVAAYWSFAR